MESRFPEMLSVRTLIAGLLCCGISTSLVQAQDAGTNVEQLGEVLAQRIVSEQQALEDVRQLTIRRMSPRPELVSSEQWQVFADTTRRRVLDNVVFRGAAASWREARTAVEMRELLEAPSGLSTPLGYRIRKLRLEVLPNMWIPGLLYEPENLTGKVPVFLNVNGHDRAGKAADYKQARCIHLARNGIIALNLEWFGMGQLAESGFSHARLNQLDLCGASGLAPFYLAQSRALDLLLSLEHADPQRVGVAGLSGGGWQTILISSLDTRVTLCNPVAGYSSFLTRIDHHSDLGDSEQTPVDLGHYADYRTLTAILAPRAALLTYNAKDNCCFASGHALQPLVESAEPVYQMLDAEERFRTHVNTDPGTHNFLLDNRQALYRMIRDQWYDGDEQRFPTTETSVEDQIRTAEELNVPLPEPNLNFHDLAMSLADSLPNAGLPPNEPEALRLWSQQLRDRLKDTIRLPEDGESAVTAEQAERTRIGETDVVRWKLKLANAWTVPVVELSRHAAGPAVLMLSDAGRVETAEQTAALLKDGCRVFAMDPFYFGDLRIAERGYLWALMISTAAERPLGIQSAQTKAVADWIRREHSTSSLKLVTSGRRTGVIGLLTKALHPELFDSLTQTETLVSLKQILHEDMTFDQAPELFCYGLLEVADIPELKILARVQ